MMPQNMLHLHDTGGISLRAIMRLSEGVADTTTDYGFLGLARPGGGLTDLALSSLSRGDDLILHDHQDGDIIITNFSSVSTTHAFGTAIRFATTGDTLGDRPLIATNHDLERMTILGNGMLESIFRQTRRD
jgi:hypothetical protein